jgi:hypothetical protein
MYICEFPGSKKNLCAKQRKKVSIVTRTHQEKGVLRITLSLINIFHLEPKEKKKKDAEKEKL